MTPTGLRPLLLWCCLTAGTLGGPDRLKFALSFERLGYGPGKERIVFTHEVTEGANDTQNASRIRPSFHVEAGQIRAWD